MSDHAIATITGYHAHVYYNSATREKAQLLRDGIAETFPQATLGRWHDRPIGPHPHWSYQVAFEKELFAEIIPWLMLNQDGLTILVHPLTGDHLADHRDFAMWLGEKLSLNLEVLQS